MEKYLRKCLDSIVNQTIYDIEIICVDDCSTDNSLKILEEYAAKDNRMKIISNTVNQGVSFSRNAGIKNSQGEYIAFVDHDDIVENTMYELLYEKTKQNEYDVVHCDVFMHKNDVVWSRSFPTILPDGSLELQEQMLKFLIVELKSDRVVETCVTGIWNKIYKRTFIVEENILFYSEKEYSHEDFLFNMQVLLKTRNIAYLPKSLYHHFFYSFSLGKTYSYKKFESTYTTIEIAKNMIERSSCFSSNQQLHERLLFRVWMNVVYGTINELRNKNKRTVFKRINCILKNPMVIEAVRTINIKKSVFDVKYSIYQYILYFYIKILIL
jgi:glycosyltransferase involved in cell wall biosynthesis